MAHTNSEILEIFEASLAQLRVPEEPELLYMPIIYSMSGGGKRLRPVLLLLTAEAFGGSVEEAMPAALAVEIFHNFTLLHDDIMDNADVRRGKPSVCAKWGGNVALLSGDAMLISAEAEAEAYRIKSAEITPNLLKKWELDARKQHGWVTIQGVSTVVTGQ